MNISSSTSYSSYTQTGMSQRPQMEKPDFETMAQELLSALDTDSSGDISSEEFTNALEGSTTLDSSALADIFATIDSDSSSSISSEELLSALEASRPKPPANEMGSMPPPPPPPSSSQDEDSESLEELFATLDADADGSLSLEEFLSMQEQTESTEQTKSQDMKTMMLERLLSHYSSNANSTTESTLNMSA